MKKIDLGQAVTILANVGVIAGIVFLAVELRQNNHMMRAQTRNDIAQSVVSLLRDISDTELLEIANKATEGLNQLTRIESNKLLYGYLAQFRTWENIYYQFRMGLFDEDEFLAERGVWEQTMQAPISIAVWCTSREFMAPVFRRELDSLLPAAGCSTTALQE
jgi:hypothetical protein